MYSTCTFAPEEDEGQVAAFLQRHPEFEQMCIRDKARAALQAVTKEDVRSILRQLTLSVSYLLTKEEPTHA